MERDEETGLEYHNARYYLPWLGRWLSADPIGIRDGVNLYGYVKNNPVMLLDPSGNNGETCGVWDEESMTCYAEECPTQSTPQDEVPAPSPPPRVRVRRKPAPPVTQSSPPETNVVPAAANESVSPSTFQPLGPGLVTVYDTTRRMTYLATISEASERVAEEIRTLAANPTLQNLDEAERMAREVSALRNATRTATQATLTTGGRIMSEALEQPRDWATVFEKYGGQRNFETFEEVARASGRSAPSVTRLAAFGRVAGPVAVTVGVGLSVWRVSEARPQDRPRVIAEEAGATGGGALGASLGTAGGVGLAGLIVGGASGPPGWLVLGLGIIGGGAGGYIGSEGGRGLVGAMLPRGGFMYDRDLADRAILEGRNPFCAQCHGPGGALDPNNEWNRRSRLRYFH